MKSGNTYCRMLAVGTALCLATGAALADPPGRVARLSYASGAVSFAPAGSNDWVQASINRPLMPGDQVWADQGGRDEVQIGSAALRMDGGTLMSVLNLDDHTAQFQMTQGRAYLRVQRLDPGDAVEVDTPNLALSIRQPGVYRLDVDPNGATTAVAVRSGQAEAYGDGNAYTIDPGQSYRFTGTGLQDYQYAQLPADDDFERWSAGRDRRHDNALARRYVSPDLIGYEDLDDSGSWRTVPQYGNVWVPNHVASDWAPYRDGHWSWVDPWGWTWVDDAPWGFAVSHYGRWTHLDAGWGWVPGPPASQPVYAPALVAFVAGAALMMERDRQPNVAWFPLGPRDVYRPAYQASPRYLTNVNTSNTIINKTEINKVVNITNITYANRQVPGAVTAVPTQAFVHAQPVRQAAVAVNRQALDKAPVVAKLAFAPQAASRTGGAPTRAAPAAVAAAAARPVIAHMAPAKMPAMAAAAVPRAGARTLVAAAPIKIVHQRDAGKPLAPLPPPRALAAGAGAPMQAHGVAAPAQAHGAPAPSQPQVAAAPPQHPGAAPRVITAPPHSEALRPPQIAAVPPRGEANRPAQIAAVPSHSQPQQAARQEPRAPAAHPEAARPPQIALQQPRPQPQHIETAPHPQPPQHAEALPHAPPPHAEPPHPQPQREAQHEAPREPPRQMAMAKPQEPHRPPPPPEEHHAQPAAQPHPPAPKPEEHHAAPEKEKQREEHQQ